MTVKTGVVLVGGFTVKLAVLLIDPSELATSTV